MKAKRERKPPAPPASGNRAIEVHITSNAANTKSEPIPDSAASYVASKYRLPLPVARVI
jgi:hypothetical protein